MQLHSSVFEWLLFVVYIKVGSLYN